MKNFTRNGQVLWPALIRKLLTLVFSLAFLMAFAAGPERTEDKNPDAVVFIQQPVNVTTCEGNPAQFTVAANGSGPLTYQWQSSTDGGTLWNNLSNGAVYTGVTASLLQINNTTAAMDGYLFRCMVSDGSSNTSASAMLRVNAAPVVQTTDIAVQICINGSATITAATYPGLSYQWQVNTGSGFVNLSNGGVYSGTNTNMLRITGAQASMEGYLYRYIATNTTTGCTALSALDTLHVLPYASITQQPVNAAVCPGGDTSFAVEATGYAAVKWQVSTNGSVWTDVPNNATYSGAATNILQVTGINAAMNNYRYRAVLYNALSCPVSSNMVFLFVRPQTSISMQPVNASVCATGTATFRVVAAGSSLTYQWQTDNGSNGSSWSPVSPGGNSSILNRTNVSMSMNGHRFRVFVSGFCGSVISNEVVLQTKRGIWLGVTSTDWHTPSNWCGGVPDATTDVLIPAGTPYEPDIIAGVGYSRSLTIDAGARLTISGGTTQMSGPFSIQGTVAYTGNGNQTVLPASHGSLEIDGSGHKYLQTSVEVYQNLVLNGTARLVTSNHVLTMKAGSNPVSGTNLATTSSSWIITGNGNAGAANTGLGGLQYETIRPQDGKVIFPVGPTDSSYNPLFLENKGVADRFIVAVNDQPIAGSFFGRTINRTWKVSEGTAGGSKVFLDLKWNKSEEQSMFDSAHVMMVRSANGMMVESRNVLTPASRPFTKTNNVDFLMLTEFSLHTFYGADAVYLPVKLTAFTAEKTSEGKALLRWAVEEAQGISAYVVQRSPSAERNFTDIGTVNARMDKAQYHFTDQRSPEALSYYRLKMIDYNGAYSYSKVIRLDNAGAADFQLRPSVTASGHTEILFKLDQERLVNLAVADASGVVQWTRSFQAAKGFHVQPLDLTRLNKGVYFIQVSAQGKILKTLTLIRQ